MEDLGRELDGGRALWVIVREGDAKFEDGIGVIALVDEEDSVPDHGIVG